MIAINSFVSKAKEQKMPSSVPLNHALYTVVKAEADRIFLSKTSAYKSGWIVKTYKERGGKYATVRDKKTPKTTGLTRWFKEKWIDLTRKNKDGTYAECGRDEASISRKGTYPLCRPSIHVNSLSPKTPTELSRKQISNAKIEKQRLKQNGRVRF